LSNDEYHLAALADFQRRFGILPGAIICHPKWRVPVRATLNRYNVLVQTVSGCLAGEIWLELVKSDQQEIAIVDE